MWKPFGSVPANSTASWRSGPDERGTLSVLSTCILTLLLCAYTSLHLNIPEHGRTGWRQQFWKRTWWVIIGLGAPEFVGYIAFREWMLSQRLEVDMQKILDNLEKSNSTATAGDVENAAVNNSDSNLEQKPPEDELFNWSRIHSHFTLMGGFVFDSKKMQHKIMDGTEERATLTAIAIRKLAEYAPDLLPNINKVDIDDKSKANGFAKFLVCIQTCWFIAQTVGRLITGLPISLLEMNTLLHAICCLLIYLAWWHKPLDIDEPYLINASTDVMRKVLAWMLVRNAQRDVILPYKDDQKGEGHYVENSSVSLRIIYEDDLETDESNTEIASMRKQLNAAKEHVQQEARHTDVVPKNAKKNGMRLYLGQKTYGFVLINTTAWASKADQENVYGSLSALYIERLRLASELRKGDGNTWLFKKQHDTYHGGEGRMLTFGSSMIRAPDRALKQWRKKSTWITPEIVLWSSLLLAGSLYGGIHLLAWNGPFPTKPQRVLWQVSCLVIASPVGLIMAGGILAIIIGILVMIYSALDACIPLTRMLKWMVRPLKGPTNKFIESDLVAPLIIMGPFFLAAAIFALMYIAARVYLVVECFINVAHLPGEVFLEPKWSQFIPHFGAG